MLPASYLRGSPSWAPLLRSHLSPCDGSGHKSLIRRGPTDENRDGDHFLYHLDLWHVLLGYHRFGVCSLQVFLWEVDLWRMLSM